MDFHVRSASFPSKGHSNEAEIEVELQSISSPSATIEATCDGLKRLGDVYSHIEEMIHLPSCQACSIQQRKELDCEMESSLELIDLCNAMQENFAELKSTVQDLLLALRRGDDASAQAKIQSYIRSIRKAQKQFKKTSKKATSDKDDCKLVRLMSRARLAAASLLESALCLLSKQVAISKRSLVSKAFQKRSVVVCQEEQLQALECTIGDLEHGAELVFRRMVQSRVALLNTLSS
jgi:DNA-binding IscR family transcriptional regulator